VATRLLGKPRAEPLLYVILRECSLGSGIFEAVAHFVEDVEMILNVLNGAVFWEFVQEGFDLLLGIGHRGFTANISLRWVAQALILLAASMQWVPRPSWFLRRAGTTNVCSGGARPLDC